MKNFSLFLLPILFGLCTCYLQTIDATPQQVYSAITEATKQIELDRILSNVPCMSVGVSYRGEEIWTTGFGYADLETGALCTSTSVHRIGSITKSISLLLLGKLWERNQIDIDRPIYDYLGDKFPIKTFNGIEVNITLRQLVSHMGGIRHYRDDIEFYQKEGCTSVFDSLKYFKDDPLIAEPGEEYHYSSFGFVLIGAVLQSVLEQNQTFESAMMDILRNELGMSATGPDRVETITLNRVKFYMANDVDVLRIAPFVDASCRWPGGGFLSNVHDLLRYGNLMIFSNKSNDGYLQQTTVNSYWNKIVFSGTTDLFNIYYGMAWEILEVKEPTCVNCVPFPFVRAVGHSGGSSGAIVYLLIVPESEIIVAVLTNVSPMPNIRDLSMDIAKTFINHLNQTDYGSENKAISLTISVMVVHTVFLLIILF